MTSTAKKGRDTIYYTAFGIVLAVLIGMCLAALYRPEVFMSENKLLTAAFNKDYKGPEFVILRNACWLERMPGGHEYDSWSVEYERDGLFVESDGGRANSPCLTDPSQKPAYVIKHSNAGYVVLTSGDEKESAFTPELVNRLLSAVATGNTAFDSQKAIDASWSVAK